MRQGPGSSFKKRTLEDLFRPPIDITFKGTFASVRTFASSFGKKHSHIYRPNVVLEKNLTVEHLFRLLISFGKT